VLNGGVANALCACGQLTQVLSYTFVITAAVFGLHKCFNTMW